MAQTSAAPLYGGAPQLATPWPPEAAEARSLPVEPWLPRFVPALIATFLIALGVGAVLHLQSGRAQIEAELQARTALAAAMLADAWQRDAREREDSGALLAQLAAAHHRHGHAVTLLIRHRDGRVLASPTAPEPWQGAPGFALASAHAAAPFAGVASIVSHSVRLPGGEEAIALHDGTAALAAWRARAQTKALMFAASAGVVLLLGFAFSWQVRRARRANALYGYSHTRMEAALEQGRCGLWDVDLACGKLYASPSMFALLGRSPSTRLLGARDVARLLHPDDGTVRRLARLILRPTESAIDVEFRLRHVQGHFIWVRARGATVQTVAGLRLVGIAVDVTEQKALAARSAKADLRLREAVESLSETFVLWDADNRLVTCNSKFQHLHGLPDAAAQPGTRFEDVARASLVPLASRRCGACPASATSCELHLPDGRWLVLNERPTKDGGFVSVGTDISALKRHEVQLMDSDRRLRSLVDTLSRSRQALEDKATELESMTRQVQDEKLKAEAANRSKSEFLANMSHELRNPLNAIIGFSDVMAMAVFGPLGDQRYREYCEDIRASGLHLLDLINDILDMAKLEAGRRELLLRDIALDPLLDEVLRLVSPRATDKALTLEREGGRGLAIEADARALKQILLNLLANAVKFTGSGGRVTLDVAVSAESVVLSVADTGIGIAAEMIDRLGEPFVQAQTQYSKDHMGSGLGLAITRSLVALHGGQMCISSRLGIGTRVDVTLPQRALGSAVVEAPRASAAEAVRASPEPRGAALAA